MTESREHKRFTTTLNFELLTPVSRAISQVFNPMSAEEKETYSSQIFLVADIPTGAELGWLTKEQRAKLRAKDASSRIEVRMKRLRDGCYVFHRFLSRRLKEYFKRNGLAINLLSKIEKAISREVEFQRLNAELWQHHYRRTVVVALLVHYHVGEDGSDQANHCYVGPPKKAADMALIEFHKAKGDRKWTTENPQLAVTKSAGLDETCCTENKQSSCNLEQSAMTKAPDSTSTHHTRDSSRITSSPLTFDDLDTSAQVQRPSRDAAEATQASEDATGDNSIVAEASARRRQLECPDANAHACVGRVASRKRRRAVNGAADSRPTEVTAKKMRISYGDNNNFKFEVRLPPFS